MGMDTKTQRAPMWIRNAYDSFVVRAPKITVLSTKTVRTNTSTSPPSVQRPQTYVGGSSPAISSEPSAPSSYATTLDQLTNDYKHRLLSFPPPPTDHRG